MLNHGAVRANSICGSGTERKILAATSDPLLPRFSASVDREQNHLWVGNETQPAKFTLKPRILAASKKPLFPRLSVSVGREPNRAKFTLKPRILAASKKPLFPRFSVSVGREQNLRF
ncbi:hypothetical protein RRG08_059496 [Elysia crispata]|uniref:Uncharacterized protein n=1 Tax=Elysia crispata TaxID=231223 RepID=A0AAE0Z864_9GAST|nr:hypothetical protein RRG08_059496 [Elysia crispata]